MRQGYCSDFKNPEIAQMRLELADAISVIENHVEIAPANQIVKLALQAHHVIVDVREGLSSFASYEPQLADATYSAAGIAAETLEAAMDVVNVRFCASGHWHAGGLPAYQALLEASIACRALRSRRLGLQDHMRRISNDVFEYVEE